jgi:hypothetical protein
LLHQQDAPLVEFEAIFQRPQVHARVQIVPRKLDRIQRVEEMHA